MTRRLGGALAAFVISTLGGCKEAAVPKRASAEPARSAREESEMRQKLINAFRMAHEQGDVERFLELVCLEGANADILDKFLTAFEADRKYKVSTIRIAPLKPEDVLESESNGARSVCDLLPVGWLQIEFDLWDEVRRANFSIQYLIGIKHGAYRIVTSRPQ